MCRNEYEDFQLASNKPSANIPRRQALLAQMRLRDTSEEQGQRRDPASQQEIGQGACPNPEIKIRRGLMEELQRDLLSQIAERKCTGGAVMRG